jgi:2-polyprenyl-3-methyl-5-hydroxy-6-metoxy-1,4-benzoquinol methylase
MSEPVPCALCEVVDARPYATENGFEAVQCRRCELVYVSPRPSVEEMKRRYEASQTHVNIASHIRQRDYKRVQARKCLEVVRRHRSSGRLLEVGSAAGYFLLEAQQAGFNVQGLDVTGPFVTHCTETLGIPAYEGTLADAPFEKGSFDVIYHRNLLSHLHEPVADFERMRELLSPEGVLVFETGNVAELAATDAGPLELPEHLYHFSEATIRRLLDKTGFSVVRIHRHGLVMQLGLFRALERMVERPQRPRARPAPPPSPTPPPPSRITRARASAAQIIRYDLGELLGRWLPRSTLVVVATR